MPQNCKLWYEQNSYFCILDRGVCGSRASRTRENIFRVNSFGVCTSTDSVLTPLWSHSLLKCVSQKGSYSNKYVFKAVTYVKCHKNSQKFFWTVQFGVFYPLFTLQWNTLLKRSLIYKPFVPSTDSLFFLGSPVLHPVKHKSIIFTLKSFVISILFILF